MKILGVSIDALSKKDVLEKISGFLKSDKQHQVVTTNPEFILEAQKDNEFRDIINSSSLSVADGMGVKMAAKYLKIKNKNKNKLVAFLQGLKVGWWGVFDRGRLDVVPEVVTGTDLVPEICKIADCRPACQSAGASRRLADRLQIADLNNQIFLLGGYGETPRLVAEKLKKEFGGLEFEYLVFEEKDIIDRINKFKPIVLFVAVNHPRAQKWIDENLSKMPSVRVAMGVGGAFDYISGRVRRAPCFLRKIGLEWVFRLIRQPFKRAGRVYNAFLRFSRLVYKNCN